MRFSFSGAGERPLAAVPHSVKIVLAAALCIQIAWHVSTPAPVARAAALTMPPDTSWLRVASFGEPIAVSQALMLYLQAFDNQAGVSIPYSDLDYGAVQAWLSAALALDPEGQYPLLMAAHLYSQVPDEKRKRQMLDFVHQQFLQDPNRRWRWLAHAAIVAKHQLDDLALALRYGEDITRYAPAAGNWARQMRIFILADMGQGEAAAVLLGGLLASGEVSDPAEINFLTLRLKELKSDEKSSKPSESR